MESADSMVATLPIYSQGAGSVGYFEDETPQGSQLPRRRGYARLQSAESDHDTGEVRARWLNAAPICTSGARRRQRRRGWRFIRIRPRIRVLFSTISSIKRRLRDSYARIMLALTIKPRYNRLPPQAYKKKPTTAISHKPRTRDMTEVEKKYMEYIRRSVTDVELARYTLSLKNTNML